MITVTNDYRDGFQIADLLGMIAVRVDKSTGDDCSNRSYLLGYEQI